MIDTPIEYRPKLRPVRRDGQNSRICTSVYYMESPPIVVPWLVVQFRVKASSGNFQFVAVSNVWSGVERV